LNQTRTTKEERKERKEDKNNIFRQSASPISDKILEIPSHIKENFEKYHPRFNENNSDSVDLNNKHNIYYQNNNSVESITNENNIEVLETKKKQKTIEPSAVAVSLMEFFYISLKEHVPFHRIHPDTPKKRISEALQFDKILKRYIESEIKFCIAYAHSIDFWKSIICNAKKLEKNIGTLLTQANQSGIKKNETLKRNFESERNGNSKYKTPNLISADD
jgi:hypothetical protein